MASFLEHHPEITVEQINRWENDPSFWSGVKSNLEWARGNIPALVAAMFKNAENSERADQWVWMQRAMHYAENGRLLGDADEGMVNLATSGKRTSGK